MKDMNAARTPNEREWLSKAVCVAKYPIRIANELYDMPRNQLRIRIGRARNAALLTKRMGENLDDSLSKKRRVKRGPTVGFAEMLCTNNLNALVYSKVPPSDRHIAQTHVQETPVVNTPAAPDIPDAT